MIIVSDNYDFDELKMYFGEPYYIQMPNGKYLKIIQPSIGEVLQLGDRYVYSTISPFTCNTTLYRVALWESGKDWNKITDYELFVSLIGVVKDISFLMKKVDFIQDKDKIVEQLYDIDFSQLKPYVLQENEESEKSIILYDQEQGIYIDEQTYKHMRAYIRYMFNQNPKEEFVKGKMAKQWVIDEEKENMKRESEKGGKSKSPLLPLVSGLINHPGFKYDLDGIKKLGIFAFMDSVQRLQVYQQSIAFLGGMYSGMMDTSKLGQEEINKRVNWLQDIYAL